MQETKVPIDNMHDTPTTLTSNMNSHKKKNKDEDVHRFAIS